MARHSHWHNIQVKKGKADAVKAKAFTKLAIAVTLAAKEGGGDPTFNFKLRMAIDAARAANMTNDKIERAVARGLGTGEGGQVEEVLYEGFGPGGAAVLIEGVTDNRARTVAEVKMIVSKNGGSIGASGSVKWMFDRKAVVRIEADQLPQDRDAFELTLIEAGADDIQSAEEGVTVLGNVKSLQMIKEAAEAQGCIIASAGFEYIPNQTVALSDADSGALEALVGVIEENDDVVSVYTNEA